jgi:hypothetical protein
MKKSISVLSEACKCIDFLPDGKKAFIDWYCDYQLREYIALFKADTLVMTADGTTLNNKEGALDDVSRRYAWIKRVLKNYEDEHAPVFPIHWNIEEMLSEKFCLLTRYI